jgi:hypothetical protein
MRTTNQMKPKNGAGINEEGSFGTEEQGCLLSWSEGVGWKCGGMDKFCVVWGFSGKV